MIALFCLFSLIQAQKLYKYLDLTPEATQEEIKSSYRELIKKYHPNKIKDDPLLYQRYLEIDEAQSILADDFKRQVYDIYGDEGLDLPKDAYGNPHKIYSISRDVRFHIGVTLEELYKGSVQQHVIEKPVCCPVCKGTGNKDRSYIKKCEHCKGKGRVDKKWCPKCGGQGFSGGNDCPKCNGQRVISPEINLDVEIERGSKNEEDITFQTYAGTLDPVLKPGDMHFNIIEQEHQRFKRIGDDLSIEIYITLKQAILGFQHSFKQLDDTQQIINIPPFSSLRESKLVFEELGMPIKPFIGNFGNLIVSFNEKFSTSKEEFDQKDQLLIKECLNGFVGNFFFCTEVVHKRQTSVLDL